MPPAAYGPEGGAPSTVETLITEGVKIENWLVGVQHRLLLGVAPERLAVPKRVPVAAASSAAVLSTAGGTAAAAGACSACAVATGAAVDRQHHGFPWRRFEARIAELTEELCLDVRFLGRAYLSRLFFALALFASAAYLNAVATMVATRRNPYNVLLDLDGNPLKSHTLPDLGHDLWAWVLRSLGHRIEYIDEHHLPDAWVAWLGRATCLFMTLHPRRFLVWRRALVIFSLLLLLRAVSVSVTVLPDASPVCRAQFGSAAGAYKLERMFPRVFQDAAAFVWAPRGVITCGDMIFSGHTTCLCVMGMIFRKYCRAKHLATRLLKRAVTERACTFIRHAVYAYCVAGFAVIVGSRLHYTLDVLLAILLSYWTFRTYHDWVRYAKLRKKARILQWLEADAVLGLDNAVYARAQAGGEAEGECALLELARKVEVAAPVAVAGTAGPAGMAGLEVASVPENHAAATAAVVAEKAPSVAVATASVESSGHNKAAAVAAAAGRREGKKRWRSLLD